ncbi:MAG: hypothetical protein FJ100_18885 [Deltaproteobacteria bacterium]|nr:hypothetical protein [Deltaproteobacteria bacterium]
MTWADVMAIAGLASACGLWVVIQRAAGRGPSGGCGSCGCAPERRAACTRPPDGTRP